MQHIAVIGSAGALGQAITKRLAHTYPKANIHAFSRNISPFSETNVNTHTIDYTEESSIEAAATLVSQHGPLDLLMVTTGILHDEYITPEKTLQQLSAEQLRHVFDANTILPALIIKHFSPLLNKTSQSVLGILSARVGSISDNRLGGWYAYRASKAALNMIIKTASIEIARKNKHAILVGLHPGTVDSPLSKPFQANVPKDSLFSPEFSAEKLLDVITQLTAMHTGKCYAWDGSEISP